MNLLEIFMSDELTQETSD